MNIEYGSLQEAQKSFQEASQEATKNFRAEIQK
jgi:hypothetical protein